MKNVEIKVKNCKTCPFSECTYEGFSKKAFTASCYAPVEVHTGKYNVKSHYNRGTSPKFCPLNTNNLKITKV